MNGSSLTIRLFYVHSRCTQIKIISQSPRTSPGELLGCHLLPRTLCFLHQHLFIAAHEPHACRTLRTEDRVHKRFRNRRLTAPSTMHAPSTVQGSHRSSNTGSYATTAPCSAAGLSHGHMHALPLASRTSREPSNDKNRRSLQLQRGCNRELSGLQGVSSGRPSGAFQRQEPSAASQNSGNRRAAVAGAVKFQEQAVGRSSWLKGSGALL